MVGLKWCWPRIDAHACAKVSVVNKSLIELVKSSTGMIMNGKEWCRPAQQGLACT